MNTWLKGLISAIIGGASNAVTLMVVDPLSYNLEEGFQRLLTVAITSGLLSAAMYLKRSPLP